MKIAIGNDHSACELKLHIKQYLSEKGYEVVDFGTDSTKSTHYPVYAKKVADAIIHGECEIGILICGTGIGISIAANKVKGIRAAVCSEPYSAKLSRQHNNANIVAFGSRVVGSAMAEMIVDEFLAARYMGDYHQIRVDMIEKIENGTEVV